MIVQALNSLRPGAHWNLNGDTLAGLEWVDQQQSRPTDAEIEAEATRLRTLIKPEKVIVERDRRLALGFNYDFGDSRGVHRIGTKKSDLDGWSEVSTYAGALIDSGDMTTTIAIVTDTGPCLVTAPEWRAIELAAAAFRQPIWAKSFALMASNPIPADFTNDSYWT